LNMRLEMRNAERMLRVALFCFAAGSCSHPVRRPSLGLLKITACIFVLSALACFCESPKLLVRPRLV